MPLDECITHKPRSTLRMLVCCTWRFTQSFPRKRAAVIYKYHSGIGESLLLFHTVFSGSKTLLCRFHGFPRSRAKSTVCKLWIFQIPSTKESNLPLCLHMVLKANFKMGSENQQHTFHKRCICPAIHQVQAASIKVSLSSIYNACQ